MKQQAVFVIFLAIMVLAASWFSKPAADSDSLPAERTASESAAYRVYIDPQTREFVAPPVFVEPDHVTYNAQDPLNYSSEGLVEQPSPIEGGGIMVDLQGRFRNTSVATINADGTVAAPCLPIRPEEAANRHDGESAATAKDGDQQ